MYRRASGAYTSIPASTTAFDYLPDSSSINDAWYMQGSYNPYSGPNKWKDLIVRIGTPRTNTGTGVWEYSLGYLNSFTATAGTDLISGITSLISKLVDGDLIEVYCTTTTPAPLVNWTPYYAKVVSATQISLHPTAADAIAGTNIIDLTTAGSGTKYIFAWKVLSVTDGSSGLTAAAGSYTVTFTPPADWFAVNYVNGSNATVGYYLRYRITDTGTGITEGGANSTTRIQSGDYSYTVDNYASGSPCAFVDVYDYDVSLANGLITQHSLSHYSFECGLIIGGGTNATYFTDYGKIIAMGGHLRVATEGHLTLGQLTSESLPYNGVFMKFADQYENVYNFNAVSTNSYINLYACSFSSQSYFYTKGNGVTQNILACNFQGGTPYWGGDQVLDRITLMAIAEGFRFTAVPGTADYNDIKIISSGGGTQRGIYFGFLTASNTDFDVVNAIFEGTFTTSIYCPTTTLTNVNFNIIDPVGFDYTTGSATGTNSNVHVNEIYSVNYTVKDINGVALQDVAVNITNALGTFTGTTDVDGVISIPVTVNRRVLDTSTDYAGGVCTMKISKAYYKTAIKLLVITSKLTDTVTLEHSPYASYAEMNTQWV